MDDFFERVEALLTKIGIRHAHDLGDRLWNCDETGLCNATASLPKKDLDVSIPLQVDQDEATPLFMGVVLPQVLACRHL